ncbi:MAG: DMT family transporter [Pseudomonadota bacterium]
MSIWIYTAALIAVAIWGGSPIAAKLAVESIDPIAVSVLRTVIAGAIVLPIALLLSIQLPGNRTQWTLLLITGFSGFVVFAFLLTIGVAMTSGSHASMILASLPLTTGAIALIWDRMKPSVLWVTGCTIALCGEALLIFSESGSTATSSIEGDLIIFFANAFASLGYVCGGRLQQEGYPSVATTFWGVSIWAVLLLPLLPFTVDLSEISGASKSSILGLLYLTVGVTIVAYVFWYWALGKGGIARIGSFQFLQPVTGVIAASWLLHESVDVSFVLASILVLGGVWLALKSK